jgi:HlyD family secretion protein
MRPRISLILVLALGFASALRAQPPASPVVAAALIEENVMATQTFVGTVMPVRTATIGSAVDGRVIEFAVEEGDRVEANQPVAQLLTETIELEIAAAEAELDDRRQQLAELENGLRPEEVEQARARMSAAQARHEFLEARRERVAQVSRTQGAATEDELQETAAAALEAEELYREAVAAHELARQGARKETIAQTRAQVSLQEAVVQQLRDRLKKHTLISRFSGYVVSKHTEVGAWVTQGGPVADVVAIDELDVVVQVDEQSIPFVQPGQDAEVEIPALPGRRFAGKIISVVPRADERSRTLPVKIRIANEITSGVPLLKAGMYARALLPVGASQAAILAPKDAVVLGGQTPVVFVLPANTKVGAPVTPQAVPVELGVSKGALIQLRGKLQPGQLVITRGNERIRPGLPVTLAEIVTADSSIPE